MTVPAGLGNRLLRLILLSNGESDGEWNYGSNSIKVNPRLRFSIFMQMVLVKVGFGPCVEEHDDPGRRVAQEVCRLIRARLDPE